MATISEAIRIAESHQQAGRLSEAEQIFRQVVGAEMHRHEIWHRLGLLACQTKQYDEAVRCIGRAVAICPKVAEYHNSLGVAYYFLGKPAEAESCFQRVLDLKPEFVEAQRNLGAVRQRVSYPVSIPSIKIQSGLDFLLLHFPPFDYPMLPSGLAYVHNALTRTELRVQTIDLNIVFFHQFHQKRFYGIADVTASGALLSADIWGYANHLEWEREEVMGLFWPDVDDMLAQIVRCRPKAVGLSVHASNRGFSNRFIRALRALSPETVVVVGGYECEFPNVGPTLIPDYVYMMIFEADLTIGPLAAAIAGGHRPKDLPGVLSRFDTPGRVFEPGPLLQNLDEADFPRYQWADLELYQPQYRTGYFPIIASRGCFWGRCRFCAECFPYRYRSAKKVADEIEEWTHRGARTFQFNESDFNGEPQMVYDLCTEIIRRNLQVSLMGQLRVQKKNTAEHFQQLRRAGFTYLRFGIDAWSDHTLRLQCKGYTFATVLQNLRDCHNTGVQTAVNMVIGVPGETEEDVDEMIQNVIRCKDYFDSMDFVNPLKLRWGSEYVADPDKYKIRFRGEKEAILSKYPQSPPESLWYSEDPYIDHDVRLKRMERIYETLRKNGVRFGPPALRTIKECLHGQVPDGGGEYRRRETLPNADAEMAATPAEGANMH